MTDKETAVISQGAGRRTGQGGKRWTPGRILSCLALFCSLLGPMHALVPAVAQARSQTLVICTGHGPKTVEIPDDSKVGDVSPGKTCPACMACPVPCATWAGRATAYPRIIAHDLSRDAARTLIRDSSWHPPHAPQSNPSAPRGPPSPG